MTHPQNINDEVEKTRKRWDKQIPKEYRQEPEQMPSGAIGKDGFLYLGFTRSGEKAFFIVWKSAHHYLRKRHCIMTRHCLIFLRDRDIDFRLCSAGRSHGVIH
jgi:hypothetical protein